MMYDTKRCIFHIPCYVDMDRKSGSQIRPYKMIEAFKENGYIVDVIMGYAKDRKKQIKQIKQNIKNGIKYDFLYSESSTMPTILTEKNHLPLHPFLDFSFIKYCKKNGLKIGLFYRDMHWKFEPYKRNVSIWKRFFSIPCYKYDLFKYRRILDYLYLPSKKIADYLPYKNKETAKYIIDILPPGCNLMELKDEQKIDSNIINIFYVGGINDNVYNFEKLFEVVQKEKELLLTVCCREEDWKKIKSKLLKYLNNRINIVHVEGKNLEKYYEKADVCSLLFNKHEYMQLSMPVKLFEYLSHNKPIVATKGTVAGEFVEKNNIGWVIEYDVDEIKNLFDYIKNNKHELNRIKENQREVIKNNTWYVRANKVINDLNK